MRNKARFQAKAYRHVRHARHCFSAAFIAAGLGLAIHPAYAETASPVKTEPPSDNLFHDVGQWSVDHGIYLNAGYVGEFASNPSGGQKPGGSAYADEFDLGANIDMNKNLNIRGGQLDILFTARDGNSLAAKNINTSPSVQEIYGGGKTYHLTQLSWKQAFDSDRYEVEFGRLPLENTFASSPYYCMFQNNDTCGNPGILGQDTNATWWPIPTWGGQFLANVTPTVAFRTGLFEGVDSQYIEQNKHSFNFGTEHDNGVLVPVQVAYHTDYSNDLYPRDYILGTIFDRGRYDDAQGRGHIGRTLIYMQADQTVWKPDPSANRGLALFGMIGIATSDTQRAAYSLEAGAVQTGTFESRPDDRIGFVVSEMHYNKDQVNPVAARSPDNVMMELNYSIAAMHGIRITPNLQYVINPDGMGDLPLPSDNKIPNAFVVGLTVKASIVDLLGIPTGTVPSW